MLEALLLAAAQATAPPAPATTPVKSPPATARPADPPKRAAPPSADLLEFLADWSEEEAGLIDEVIVSAAAARPPRKEPAP